MRASLCLLLVCGWFQSWAEETPPVQPAPEKPVVKAELSIAELEACIPLLASEDYEIRNAAYRKLMEAAERALPLVNQALPKAQDLEQKTLLTRLVDLCDSGGGIVNGMSVSISVNKTEVAPGDTLEFSAKYVNHTDKALVIYLGSNARRRKGEFIPRLLDGEAKLEFARTGGYGFAGGPRLLYSEIPARSSMQLTFSIVVDIPKSKVKPVEVKREKDENGFVETSVIEAEPGPNPKWQPEPGAHPLKLTTGPVTAYILPNSPRTLHSPTGTFTTTTPNWGGELFSNEVKITVKEK